MKTIAAILILIPTLLSAQARAEAFQGPNGELHPFTTDGCTHFPDGTAEEPALWQHCCVAHDLKYWAGGSYADRMKADFELGECVAATGHAVIGAAMVEGVRVGGSPFLPTPWRWGYGWEKLRGYASLSEDETAAVQQLTPFDLATVPVIK